MVETLSPFTTESDRRVKILLFLVGIGFSLLGFRLFHLQVVRGAAMARLADLNRTQVIPLQAPRGFIWDRNHEILVDNAPSFSLLFSAQSVPVETQRELADTLVRYFPSQEAVVHKKMAEARRSGKMTRILRGIPHNVALALIERKMTLPGVSVLAEPQRRARHGALAAHLLGYVDEIGPAQLKRQADMYKSGDIIGRGGLESVYDAQLRGIDGGLQFETDAVGHHVRTVQRISSQSGTDLVLTIDRNVQQALETAMAKVGKRGAAVALDPQTGAVIALASWPSFDPTGDLVPYLKDPDKPFFNRVLQGEYPSGSVFKIVTAAAGLEDKWNIRRAFTCTGEYQLGKMSFGCWKVHGLQNFMGAMAWSCNIYFYNMGLKAGPDAIQALARDFGYGHKTGIDLPSERSGFIPDRSWKRQVYKSGWFDGDTVNLSIGQGAVAVTPIQTAVALSALANGGTVYKPYLVSQMLDPAGHVVYQQAPEVRRKITLKPETWKILWQSVEGVVQSGTGRGIFRPDLAGAGKTGTAQNPHGEAHAWFAGYAGRKGEPPAMAFAVIMEHGGHGSTSAVPVARAAIDAFFPPPPSETPRG